MLRSLTSRSLVTAEEMRSDGTEERRSVEEAPDLSCGPVPLIQDIYSHRAEVEDTVTYSCRTRPPARTSPGTEDTLLMFIMIGLFPMLSKRTVSCSGGQKYFLTAALMRMSSGIGCRFLPTVC